MDTGGDINDDDDDDDDSFAMIYDYNFMIVWLFDPFLVCSSQANNIRFDYESRSYQNLSKRTSSSVSIQQQQLGNNIMVAKIILW